MRRGRLEDAVRAADDALRNERERGYSGHATQTAKQALVEAIEVALALGDTTKAAELVQSIEAVAPGLRSPYLDAQATRFRGRLASEPERLATAAARFRDLRIPFWQAVTLLEHGELTGDDSSLADARKISERLEARPWLDRLAAAKAATRAETPA